MWNETIFRNPEVFEPDYLPDAFLHRNSQLEQLAFDLKPALSGSRPVNCLCLGPPATGKTTAVRIIFKQLEEYGNCATAYVNCLFVGSKHQVFAKVFEQLFGYPPPPNTPFPKLYEATFEKLIQEEKVLVVALDDANALEGHLLNDVFRSMLKAHEDVEGVRVGVVVMTTDPSLPSKLDFVLADEVTFPPYSKSEMRDILSSRARAGFFDGVLEDDALDAIVNAAYEVGDLRYGIALLRLAGLEAEKRASRKIEPKDVESARERGRRALVEKIVKALSREEKILLKLAYEHLNTKAGKLFREYRKYIRVGYTKFNETLRRLETLRLVDVVHVGDKPSRGVSRIVVGNFDPLIVLSALSSS